MTRGAEGIVLSQKKYVLDLLSETYMLRCKPVVSPIYVKAEMSADAGEQIDCESYSEIGRILWTQYFIT
jgi:hypothetical protein